MAFNSGGTRVGRAVLDLSIDGGGVVRGVADAKANMQSLSRSIAQTQREIGNQAFKFSGRDQIAEAAKLTAAVQRVGGANRLVAADQARVNASVRDAIERYRLMGRVAPQAMLDIEKATRGASAATGTFFSRNVALGSFMGTFGAQFAMGAVRGMLSFGQHLVENAGNVIDLSNKLNVGTDAIQEWMHISSQAGVPIEAFSKATYRLGLNLAGGGDSLEAALGRVGLSMKELRALRPEDQLKAVLGALGQITDEGERSKLGNLLLGKSFEQLAGVAGTAYANMARDAKKSTREQLEALDSLGDYAARWRRDMETAATSVIGGAAKGVYKFWETVMPVIDRQAGDGSAIKFHGDGMGMARINAEAAAAVAKNAQAQEDYVKSLGKVRAELARLTPAQRAEIDTQLEAAEKLHRTSAAIGELEEKFGLAEGTLQVYVAQMKDAHTASDKLAKSQKDADEAAKKFRDSVTSLTERFGRWVQVVDGSAVGRKDLMDFFTAMPPAIEATAASIEARLIPSMQGFEVLLDRAERLKQIREELERGGYLPAMTDPTNQGASADVPAAVAAAQKELRERALQPFTDAFRNIQSEVTGRLFSTLLTGGNSESKKAAKAAREDYERIAKSGRASAEEITRAFRAMTEANEAAHTRWADRFKSIWDGVKRHLFALFDSILERFLNRFLNGMLNAFLNGGVGQRLMNLLGQLGAQLLGGGGKPGGPGGGPGGGGPGIDIDVTVPLGPFLGGPIAGRPDPTLFRPIQLWGRDNLPPMPPLAGVGPTFGGGGGVPPWRGRSLSSMAVRLPALNMPDMSAIRGLSVPLGQVAPRSAEAPVLYSPTLHITVHTPDAAGFRKAIDDEIIPAIKRELVFNRQGLRTSIKRAALE